MKINIKEQLISIYNSVTNGNSKKIIPVQGNINSGESTIIGNEFLQYFIELGKLSRTDNVLDVGSGFGRMAIPLTEYLHLSTEYHGIEIIKKGYDWCSKNISSRFRNFKFQHMDVRNDRYNPQGKIKASEFKFPFEDETFDFVILTSVFTHMLPADLENYLSEISRVTKKNGRSLITYFLLNDESAQLLNEGKGHYQMQFDYQNCKIESEEDPEYAISYPESEIKNLYAKHSLNTESVHYGNWCGRQDYLSHQDIVIGVKNR